MAEENKRILKALVVDDNEVNTLVLANMLELFGVAADLAFCGYQAIKMLQELEYDIVFIDHVMPKMDGVQTTKAIRDMFSLKKRIIIIALTSSKTEEIKGLYQAAGADDVYAKPLGLLELGQILKQSFCWVSGTDCVNRNPVIPKDWMELRIREILEEIIEINYDIGLQYAMGNYGNYIEHLRVSVKDINTCLRTTKNGYENHAFDEMRIGVHNIRSVFSNIGAINLAGLAKELEQYIIKSDIPAMEFYYDYYMDRLENFCNKLIKALNRYDDLTKNKIDIKEDISVPMSVNEYEQSINNAIYYIKRYDYAAILGELKLLQQRGQPEYKYEVELALVEIMNYQYENTLLRLINIKKKIEHSPI